MTRGLVRGGHAIMILDLGDRVHELAKMDRGAAFLDDSSSR
jgi:hypothetical protein